MALISNLKDLLAGNNTLKSRFKPSSIECQLAAIQNDNFPFKLGNNMPSAQGFALTGSLEAPWILPPIHNSTAPSGTGTPLFFNLQAHYQKSLGCSANQRQELGFARNTQNQKWMILGREISSARSPREYSNLQSKALFYIYLALHLLHFSLPRCYMEGAAADFGSHLKW